MEFKERFTKARIALLSRHPFWGQLALFLRLKEDPTCPTTAVNLNGDFLYNPEHVETLGQQELEFEIAHELGHLFTKTITRFPARGNFACWNYASDIVIDTLLQASGLERSRVSCKAIPDETIKKYKGNITEQVYKDLLKEADSKTCGDCGETNETEQGQEGDSQSQGSGEAGENSKETSGGEGNSSNCSCSCHKGNSCQSKAHPKDVRKCTVAASIAEDKEGDEEKTINWKQRVLGAAAQAKSRGKLPGVLDGFIAEILEPKVPWQDVLRAYAARTLKGKRTWTRRNKRSYSIGVYLPGKDPKLPTATVALDTSGSISNEELVRFLSETSEILRIAGGSIRLILFDAQVYHNDILKQESLQALKVQRGGTDFFPVFEAIKDSPPNLLVIFTDLFAPYPKENPNYPVIWAHPKSFNEEEVPFGIKLLVED